MYMNAQNLFLLLPMKKNSGIQGWKKSKIGWCLTTLDKALWITAVAQGPCFLSLQHYPGMSRRGGDESLSLGLYREQRDYSPPWTLLVTKIQKAEVAQDLCSSLFCLLKTNHTALHISAQTLLQLRRDSHDERFRMGTAANCSRTLPCGCEINQPR